MARITDAPNSENYLVGQEVRIVEDKDHGGKSTWHDKVGVISDFILHKAYDEHIIVSFPPHQVPEVLMNAATTHGGIGHFSASQLELTNRYLTLIGVADPDLAEQVKDLCPQKLCPEHWVLALLWLGANEFSRNPRAFVGSSYEIFDDEE